ncbi:hypothetical protein [Pseudofulvibacter geojedonensis]|uniref:Fibronectin type III domain protein n=1 Tax=Pseudofulvibacter geojedonensis TaxID=1123758 RepID=A0ABW3HZA5_9FLAO
MKFKKENNKSFFTNKYKVFLLYVIISLLFFNVNAQQVQDTLAVENPQIVVLSRPQKNGSIMLRWAVTKSNAWRKLNKYGYLVKRYTITRNKSTLSIPIEKDLGIFKPKVLESWMALIEENDNAAVMAQSLYGDTFEVEGIDELSAIVNLAEEQEQRFTWGLYAADQDFNVAEMAGLALVDNTVLPNEKYVYKISSLVPQEELTIAEGGVFVGLEDYEQLPKPLDLAGTFLDGKAMLSWNYAIHKELYNSYYIERSYDGKNFIRLNKLPLTSLNNSDKTDAKRMFYIDSVTNGKDYFYRVIGKTPFGELSPISKVISGQGKKVLAYVPRITNKHYLDDKRIILEWEFLEEGNEHIKGFELSRSNKVKGNYKVVMKNIPPEARKIQYNDLEPTNYLTITAIGKNGSSRTSFPSLVQPVDSIPPVRPTGFKGVIDSLGIVTLKWDENKEKDILGYRVYRGNNRNEEYSQITVSPHTGTIYYDSISVKNLNPKVFYTLVAVDQRFNMSKTSEILEIKKPDFIAPTQPVFKAYKVKDGVVNLKWANSSSKDVVKHEIYRKEQNDKDWTLMHTVEMLQGPINNIQLDSWIDENVKQGNRYSYTIIAKDESNLESDPAPPVNIVIPKTSLQPPVMGISSYVDRKARYIELYWKKYKQENVAEIAIYKTIKGKKMSLYRNVLPTVTRLVDVKVQPNNEYVYMFRAVYKDGRVSKIATINVKY